VPEGPFARSYGPLRQKARCGRHTAFQQVADQLLPPLEGDRAVGQGVTQFRTGFHQSRESEEFVLTVLQITIAIGNYQLTAHGLPLERGGKGTAPGPAERRRLCDKIDDCLVNLSIEQSMYQRTPGALRRPWICYRPPQRRRGLKSIDHREHTCGKVVPDLALVEHPV
jgi:hypothetical protein